MYDGPAFDPLEDFFAPDTAPGPLEAASEKRWRIFETWFDRLDCLGVSREASGYISSVMTSEVIQEAMLEEAKKAQIQMMNDIAEQHKSAMLRATPQQSISDAEQFSKMRFTDSPSKPERKHTPWWKRWF